MASNKNDLEPQKQGKNKEKQAFGHKETTNAPRTQKVPTIAELKTYIRVKYGSYKKAGRAADISQGRVRQLVNGFDLPFDSDIIAQLAEGWGIDAPTLALIFWKHKEVKKE